jgi:hypothetical protein
MKLKIRGTEQEILHIEEKLELIIDELQGHLSHIEEEREGDFWRMSKHEPDAVKVSQIVSSALNILTSGFKDLRDFTFEFKSEDNE